MTTPSLRIFVLGGDLGAAMAAIYQEIIGKTAYADEYYEDAGGECSEVIISLFE